MQHLDLELQLERAQRLDLLSQLAQMLLISKGIMQHFLEDLETLVLELLQLVLKA